MDESVGSVEAHADEVKFLGRGHPVIVKGEESDTARISQRGNCGIDDRPLINAQAESLLSRSILTSPSGKTARISNAPPIASM